MTHHNGQPVFQRGGAGAGRGDNAHGVTQVNAFSATTRKAAPIGQAQYSSDMASGTSPALSNGSQASYNVQNAATHAPGEGMSQVRSTYKESRKAGMSPDASRGAALNPYSYQSGSGPGGNVGPTISMATDYKGNAV
jgi:hypothetical protein